MFLQVRFGGEEKKGKNGRVHKRKEKVHSCDQGEGAPVDYYSHQYRRALEGEGTATVVSYRKGERGEKERKSNRNPLMIAWRG